MIKPLGVLALVRLARFSLHVGCLGIRLQQHAAGCDLSECPKHGTSHRHPSSSHWTAALPATSSARPKPSGSLRGVLHTLLEVSVAADPHFHENSLTQRDLAVFQKQLSSKARTTQRTVGQLSLTRLRPQSVVRLRSGANERDFEPPSESPEKPKFRPPRSPKRLHTSAYGFLLR